MLYSFRLEQWCRVVPAVVATILTTRILWSHLGNPSKWNLDARFSTRSCMLMPTGELLQYRVGTYQLGVHCVQIFLSMHALVCSGEFRDKTWSSIFVRNIESMLCLVIQIIVVVFPCLLNCGLTVWRYNLRSMRAVVSTHHLFPLILIKFTKHHSLLYCPSLPLAHSQAFTTTATDVPPNKQPHHYW